jgi:hypothetical protein
MNTNPIGSARIADKFFQLISNKVVFNISASVND